jgi:hypothetical protein
MCSAGIQIPSICDQSQRRSDFIIAVARVIIGIEALGGIGFIVVSALKTVALDLTRDVLIIDVHHVISSSTVGLALVDRSEASWRPGRAWRAEESTGFMPDEPDCLVPFRHGRLCPLAATHQLLRCASQESTSAPSTSKMAACAMRRRVCGAQKGDLARWGKFRLRPLTRKVHWSAPERIGNAKRGGGRDTQVWLDRGVGGEFAGGVVMGCGKM